MISMIYYFCKQVKIEVSNFSNAIKTKAE